MHSRFFALTAALLVASPSFGITDVDVFLSAPTRMPLVETGLSAELRALVASGRVASVEPRLGVPTVVFAPRSDRAPDLRAQGLTPEAVARRTLFTWAPLYRSSAVRLAESPLLHVHDLGEGAVVVQFEHRVDGVKVFQERINVVMTQRLELVAITGAHSALPWVERHFKLSPQAALSVAFEGAFGPAVAPQAFQMTGYDAAGAGRFEAPGLESHTLSLARTMQVLFPDVAGRALLPAFYTELEGAPAGSTSSELIGTVVSALDGRVLWRHSLTANDAYVYRVWADPATLRPLDGPNGRATPHPTGLPDFTVLPFVAPSFVSVAHAGLSTGDHWLGAAVTESTGNNVEAYADLAAPDGFGAGDVRGVPVSNAFIDLYDVTQGPVSPTQRNSGITQLFYNVNWLHDAWYDRGFDEAAGNAQALNFGRGGAEGDSIKAESQDSAGFNNANMSTPADGARPRMQMYVWTPASLSRLTLQPQNTNPVVGTASFGPTSFNVTGTVALAVDATAPVNDGCTALTNNVAGKVVLVDRGTCSFKTKALNIQNAGGIAMILANNQPVANPPGLGDDATITTPITIAALSISQAEGNSLKAALLNGAVTAQLERAPANNRDGSIDNTVVAHEWGHYFHHRLSTTGSKQGSAMSEGWGDFTALMMTTEASDAMRMNNTNFGGSYALAVWDTDSSVVPTNASYFGIRRAPYSVDFARNALTFKHIADGEALPTAHPILAFGANSEVHNAGEVWAVTLWEAYVALLRTAPRLTFAQAQDRMMRYLVAGLKAMPVDATYTEARDAILAAAGANDLADFTVLANAFARRGMGQNAISPARDSTNFSGVVEDFGFGNDVALVSGTLTDDDAVEFCDRDGTLDVGEKGRLHLTIKNTGLGPLSAVTGTVSSPTMGVVLAPTALTFPTIAPFATASIDVAVRLPASLATRGTIDVAVALNDPTLRPAGARTRTLTFLVQSDDVPASSANDSVEGRPVAWAFTNTSMTSSYNWSVEAVDPLQHFLHGPNAGETADFALVSPALVVGTAPFSFTYQSRWNFEFSTGPDTYWDGAVLELSTDNGMTWTDIGASATPGYNGTLTNVSGNPLGNRQAWGASSAGYPAFVPSTVNLGTTYSGQTVQIRFRLASDQGTSEVGLDVDDFVFTGITNTPFPAAVAHRNQCLNRAPIANAGPDLTVDERSMVTLTATASTDPDNDMLTATWAQTAGPSVMLTNGTFTAPEVTADTTLTFSLLVNDGHVPSAVADTVDVRVRQVNRAPTVNAGMDLSVDERTPFQLTSTSMDADGDTLSLTWRQVSGPPAQLGDTHARTLTTVAPEVTMDSTLVFEVRVTDGTDAATDQVSVAVKQVNRPPNAQALADGFADPGATVVLSGFVVDPDGDMTTVAWTQTAGPDVSLAPANALTPVFTAPRVTTNTTLTFQLLASDGRATSAPAVVNVVVRGANVGPTARPGEDVTVESGGTVSLDGSTSSDPEGSALSYQWQQEGEGSRLTFDSSTKASVTVTAPNVSAQERLTVVLYVRDAAGAVGNATVHVTVTPKAAGCGCAGVSGFEPLAGLLLALAFRRRARKS